MIKISVVLPCRNESENLPSLIPEIIRNIPSKFAYEIICIDDGSTDGTGEVIKILAKKNKNIKGIIFYKNFGHQQSLRAGIEKSSGDAIIMMDADFQHPPGKIREFIKLWEKGFDLVQARKVKDQTSSLIMKIQRLFGYRIWKFVTNDTISPGISDFRLVSKEIREHIISSHENELFLRGLVGLVANNSIIIDYVVGKRKYGKSSYTLKMFLDMFINGFISFSVTPLRFATVLGLIIFLGVGAFIIIDIVRALITGEKIVKGYITLSMLTLGVNSILMIYLGILGEYIGVIFKEVKKRPHFIIKDTINL